MCIGSGGGRVEIEETPEEKIARQARASEKDRETAKRREARQDVLEEDISEMRQGSGRRSLLRGGRGGVGFYNRYNV